MAEVTTGIDLSALPDNLKKHVQEERSPILEQIMISDNSFLDYMQLFDGVTDELPLTEMFIDSVLQPGNKDDFTPKGKVGFKARIGKVRPCKVDLTLKPTQIKAMWQSYLGKIKKSSNSNVYSLLFEEEIVNAIIRRVKNDVRLKALFKGKYNPAGTMPEDTMEGILRLLATDFVAANVFNGDPITVSNAIDQVEGVYDLVPGQYAQEDLVAIMDPTIPKLYKRDYRMTHGGLQYNSGFEKTVIDGTNTEMIGEPGLAGTGAILITPRNNLAWLTESTGKQDSIIVEKAKRNIDIMMDFDAAGEVAIKELVWMNDAALEWVTADDARIAAG